MSGVAHFLFEAIDRRFPVVERLDYAPRGIERLALAATTFRPSRSRWRARFHTSGLAHRSLSRTLRRRLAEVDQDFDLALQVHGWAGGQPKPYALFIDQTRLMSERGWPQWLPLARHERSRLLTLERAMYHEAFHVFVMGEPTRESLLADYDVDPSCVTVTGGGLNLEALPAPSGPAGDPALLFVGRDFERKGGDDLLGAFRRVREQVPDAALHIVGVEDRFEVPGVVNHGKISRERLGELYRSARLVCVPSRYEPYGFVLVEAMAYGVPCIGTTVQSIPDILGGGQGGLLVPPGDPDQLADAAIRLLRDDDLARTLGSAGRQWMEDNLTWDRVVERMSPALSRVPRRAD